MYFFYSSKQLQAELDGKRICVETLEQQRIISQQRMEECWKHLANMRAERDQVCRRTNQQSGAGMAQRLCNGLPRNDPGFNSRRGRCKNRASRPLQGTVNGGAVFK